MTHQDAESIIAIAALAAMADGSQDANELASIREAAARLGVTSADGAVGEAGAGQLSVAQLSSRLSSEDARRTAYDVAAAVCNASDPANPLEVDFLRSLATSLGIDASASNSAVSSVLQQTAAVGVTPVGVTPVAAPASTAPSVDALDTHTLDQAILTAALELLPDRLANLGILPLQLRLVRHIGQQYGQQMDANQVKDLVATFGLGAAAQILESVVRKAFGGIAGSLLGGLLGGAAGMAAGGAVTFASTYALGHAAQQYYAQGRSLSTADMKALFSRFQSEASTIYPRVQGRVGEMARGGSLGALLR